MFTASMIGDVLGIGLASCDHAAIEKYREAVETLTIAKHPCPTSPGGCGSTDCPGRGGAPLRGGPRGRALAVPTRSRGPCAHSPCAVAWCAVSPARAHKARASQPAAWLSRPAPTGLRRSRPLHPAPVCGRVRWGQLAGVLHFVRPLAGGGGPSPIILPSAPLRAAAWPPRA